ncbi:Tetratricopeptide-like helical domain superfamily [Sesbania bispinosa]|nr:Tetratricopeptide-like helical domain superfamily [Sesbania bispinosa]
MPALRIHGYALAVSFCFIIVIAASQRTDPSEVKALMDIRKSLIDPMDHLKNWKKGDPCAANWTGVLCFDRKEADGYFHIRELYLMTRNLSGSLAPQLGQLSYLEILNFMWNNLTGTIPKEIGNITSLKLLLLSGNKLSGSLPDELGNLSKLNRFQVDENQLSGLVPESFANLINVKHLHMNNNSFSGQIPSQLSNLSILLHLLLDNNNLSGSLPPEFSMLQSLAILQLDNNNFSGNGIPSTYANLSNLVKLSLRNCSLQGAVPDFSPIPKLSYLDLSWNQFTGPIPSKKLADNMTTVDLSNNHLNGSIPRSFYPHLQKLALENNLLSGSVPASIWQNLSFSRSAKLTIGPRGYGNVYKGILCDETFVAIKRAEENSLQGQKEFLTEIELLSRLHHRNLVSLIGYCNEEGEQMLVYEFMPNGTLRDWISGSGLPGPRNMMTHKLTDKSDVYSLGSVSGAFNSMQPISRGKNIVREALVIVHVFGSIHYTLTHMGYGYATLRCCMMQVRFQCSSSTGAIARYARSGQIHNVRKVFDETPHSHRTIASWNAIVAAHFEAHQPREAILLFEKMPERNTVSWNGMISGYVKNGMITEARKIFDTMPDRNVVFVDFDGSRLRARGHGRRSRTALLGNAPQECGVVDSYAWWVVERVSC